MEREREREEEGDGEGKGEDKGEGEGEGEGEVADGFASGKIRSREDFEIYLSTARIKVNHTSQPGRIRHHITHHIRIN